MPKRAETPREVACASVEAVKAAKWTDVETTRLDPGE
jgi:hypothetical protein